MSIDLTDLNDAYMSAGDGRVPNGTYDARLVKAQVQLSKAQNRQVVWSMEVKIPETGRTASVKKFSPLNKDQMHYLKWDLEKLGVTLNDMNQLHEALWDLTGTIVEIEVQSG